MRVKRGSSGVVETRLSFEGGLDRKREREMGGQGSDEVGSAGGREGEVEEEAMRTNGEESWFRNVSAGTMVEGGAYQVKVKT